jgi:hypothetical protein
MAEILSIYHERLDDVPLIIGMAKQLGFDRNAQSTPWHPRFTAGTE